METKIANGVKYHINQNYGQVVIENPTIKNFYATRWYEGVYDEVRKCNPQEVYFRIYNDCECNWSCSGDEAAFEYIVDIFGKEVAETIVRI